LIFRIYDDGIYHHKCRNPLLTLQNLAKGRLQDWAERVFQPIGYILWDSYPIRVSAFSVPHSVQVASGAHIASYLLSRYGSFPEDKVGEG
jgi:hypothetical protein